MRITGDFPTGPLSDLYQDRYSSAPSLQYPLDLGNLEQPHYILFNISVPEKSSYVKNGSFAVTEQSITSQADINRAATNQLGSSTDPFSLLGSAGIAGGALAVGGAVSGALKYATSGKPITTAGLVGSALPGALGGLGAGAILSLVDLTTKTRRTEQEIKLYIPNNIIQQFAAKYSEVSMTEALGDAGFAAQATQATGSSIASTTKGVLENMTGAGRSVDLNSAGPGSAVFAEGTGKLAAKTGQFGNDIQKVALASYGYAQNPQVEVLFDSPALREFQFDFKFTPKNAKESQSVLDIIKTFKFHAAPELVPGNGGARYFIPPSMFDISFIYNHNLNDKLFKISTCVCTGVDVNYVTAGQFATYYDGTPVEIEMVLKFKEIEIIHKDLVTQGY